ncbi:MAG: hypothetical protein BGO41_00815 [Clostridiales bacterium 38-18]|nr:MAG: hypothetical protein BGO41_00815 [Clostridiales bacterium 38-18]
MTTIIYNKTAARLTGISLILMALISFFAYGYAHSSLIVTGDAEATLSNLSASKGLFTGEIIGWGFIWLTDLIVTWGLCTYFKPINKNHRASSPQILPQTRLWLKKNLSMVAAGFRLVYTVMLGIGILSLISASRMIDGGNSADIMAKINQFDQIWSLGLILFGVHLFLTGLLALKSVGLPKLISYLVLIAGVSYTLVHMLYNFTPNLTDMTQTLEMILMLPMAIGELSLAAWLLIKGAS